MKHENNAAGRLLLLLRKAKSINEKGLRTRDGWAKLFRIPPDDTAQLYHKVSKLWAIPQVVKRQVEQLPDINPRAYLTWISLLDQAIKGQTLDGQWQQLTALITNDALNSLEVCSDKLRQHNPEALLNSEQLTKIHTDVQDLMNDVAEGDIDDDIKAFILKHLDIIDRSIRDYAIDGSEAIRTAAMATVGAVVVQKDVYEKSKDTKLGDRFWKVLGRLLVLLSVTHTMLQLGNIGVDLLPAPSVEQDTLVESK